MGSVFRALQLAWCDDMSHSLPSVCSVLAISMLESQGRGRTWSRLTEVISSHITTPNEKMSSHGPRCPPTHMFAVGRLPHQSSCMPMRMMHMPKHTCGCCTYKHKQAWLTGRPSSMSGAMYVQVPLQLSLVLVADVASCSLMWSARPAHNGHCQDSEG